MKTPKEGRGKRKPCKCHIRGIVNIWPNDKEVPILVDPYYWEKYLRQFKFCPLCGKKLSLPQKQGKRA